MLGNYEAFIIVEGGQRNVCFTLKREQLAPCPWNRSKH